MSLKDFFNNQNSTPNNKEMIRGATGARGETPHVPSLSMYSYVAPSDYDGSNPDLTGASTTMKVEQQGVDVSNSYTYSRTNGTGVTSTINATTGVLTVSGLTEDESYVDVIATEKAGGSGRVFTVRFHMAKAIGGQAVVDGSSVDDSTIGLNGSSELEVKDNSIGKTQLGTNYVDDDSIELDGSDQVSIKSIGGKIVERSGTYSGNDYTESDFIIDNVSRLLDVSAIVPANAKWAILNIDFDFGALGASSPAVLEFGPGEYAGFVFNAARYANKDMIAQLIVPVSNQILTYKANEPVVGTLNFDIVISGWII